MKYFVLSLIVVLLHTNLNAQSETYSITINAQETVLKANPTADNISNVLIINSKKKDGKLIIENNRLNEEYKYERRFFLMNELDAEIELNFTNINLHKKQLLLKELYKKTETNKNYFLYTIAIPSHPNEAALVRVRRFMLCKVIIK